MDSTAYIDESFRGGPNGCYVVAAVLVLDVQAAELRQDVLQLFGGRRRRFHWHSEEADQRRHMLEFIARARLPIVAVSKDLPNLTSQERVRAHCLERLLWELKEVGADRLVLESRQVRNNSRDRRTIMAAQVAGKAARQMRYAFGLPQEEPLLWLADAIASAVAADVYAPGVGYLELVGFAMERVAL